MRAVVGSGRCGSSLLMQMLAFGGEPVTGLFPSFEDAALLDELETAAAVATGPPFVKILVPRERPILLERAWLRELAPSRFVWIDRDPVAQALSTCKFLRIVSGVQASPSQRRGIARQIRHEREHFPKVIASEGHELLRLRFEDLIGRPETVCSMLVDFFDLDGFDEEAAVDAVVARGPAALPYLLERELMAIDAIVCGATRLLGVGGRP